MWHDSHPSDPQLLMELEGELSRRASRKIERHLSACRRCRARRQKLETAIADWTRLQRRTAVEVPSSDGPRALLRARIEQLGLRQEPSRGGLAHWKLTFAACAVILLAALIAKHSSSGAGRVAAVPDSRLTPGATLRATREAVCSQPNTKNRTVPAALRRKVFESYGLRDASPRDFEVDYLITPALGGADDIHNLWPQPYHSTVWNAEVKDALEDRLRDLVCDGRLDLPAAQREIAADWIAAYKKYFHTDRPLNSR
jgi:anti-sigma factor RsiW